MFLSLQSKIPDSLSTFNPFCSSKQPSTSHFYGFVCSGNVLWVDSGLTFLHASRGVLETHPCCTPLYGSAVSPHVCPPPPFVPPSVSMLTDIQAVSMSWQFWPCVHTHLSVPLFPVLLGEYLQVEWWSHTGILVSPRGPAAVFVSAAKPLCSPASSIWGPLCPCPPLAPDFLTRNLLSFGALLPCRTAHG